MAIVTAHVGSFGGQALAPDDDTHDANVPRLRGRRSDAAAFYVRLCVWGLLLFE